MWAALFARQHTTGTVGDCTAFVPFHGLSNFLKLPSHLLDYSNERQEVIMPSFYPAVAQICL